MDQYILFGGGKKIIDSIKYKLSHTLEEIKGNEQVTIKMVISNCDKKEQNMIKWINADNILFSGIGSYIIKNLKNNKETKININNPVSSPDGKYLIYVKLKEKFVNICLFDFIKNVEIIIMKQKKFIKNELYDFEPYYDPTISPIKYIWLTKNKILLDIAQNNKGNLHKNDKIVLYLINLNNFKPQFLTTIAINQPHYLIKQTNNKIIFGNIDYENRITTIYNYNLKTQKLSKNITFNGLQQSLGPRVSPDGKHMIVKYDYEHQDFDYTSDLIIITLKNNKQKRITKNIQIGKVLWLDSNNIITKIMYGPYHQIYKINLETLNITQLTNNPTSILNFDIFNNKIIYLDKNAHGSYSIKTINLDNNEMNQILFMPLLKNISMGKCVEIMWNGTFKNMIGLLIYPINYNPNKKYKLIVDIHGGGFGSLISLAGTIFRECTVLEWHLWASLFNCIVFIPEFRSAMIYGDCAYINGKKNYYNIIDDDIKDIESGVDYLISQNIINKNNMIIIGASAGAHRVNWLPVVSHRYKAIISVDGWNEGQEVFDKMTDKDYEELIGDEQKKYYEEFYGGEEKNWMINSPLANINKVKTPMLFIMGNPRLGGVDNFDTIKTYYKELKKRNIDTEYMYIKDEGHNFTKPKNMKKILNKVILWIEKYL